MADGKIIIDTKIDSSGAEKGIGNLNSIASKGLKGFTGAIAVVGTALTGLGGFAIKAGIDFESAFTGVKKTVDGTEEQFQQLENAIRNMAKNMPESASEIAGVAEAAGQLGIKTEKIEGFTKAMAELGDSTNMTSEEASTQLARLANITGMSQDNFDRLGSVIVDLGNNLATTESEITAMGLRLAGAGHQVGMSEAQIMSFAGALSSVGIEAEAGGSAFSKVMIDIQLACENGGTQLDKFAKVANMSSSDFKKAFKDDASGAILSFIQGLSKCKEKGISAIKVLDDMDIKEVRLRDTLLRASGASDVFADALKIGTNAWEENTALTKEAETRYATMESQLKMLKNSVVDLGISFYKDINNPMAEIVKSANDMVGQLSEAFKNGGFEGLTNELGNVFAQIVTGIAQQTPNIINASVNVIQSFLQGIQDNLPQIADGAINIVTSLVEGIINTLPQLLEVGVQAIGELGNGIAESLPELIPKAIDCILTLVDNMVDNIDMLIDVGIQIIFAIADGLIQSLPTLIEKVPVIINKFWEAFDRNLGKILQAGIKLIIKLGEGIIKSIPLIIANAGEICKAILNTIVHLDLLSVGKSLMTKLGTGIKEMGGSIINIAKGIGKNIIDGIKNGLSAGIGSLKNKALEVGVVVKNSFKDFFNIHSPSRLMRDLIGKNIIAGISVGMENELHNAISVAKDICSKINNTFKQELNKENAKAYIDSIYNWGGSFAVLAEELQNAKDNIEIVNSKSIDDNIWYRDAKYRLEDTKSQLEELSETISDIEDKSTKESLQKKEKALQKQQKIIQQEVDYYKEAAQEEIDIAKENAKKQLEIANEKKDKLIQLSKAITDALKERLEKEKQLELDKIEEEQKAEEEAYNKKIARIDKITNRKIDNLKREQKALDEQKESENREDELQKSKDSINILKTKMANTKSESEKKALALKLQDEEKAMSKKQDDWHREDEKARIQEEIDKAQEKANRKKERLKEDFEESKKHLEKKKKNVEEYYKTLLETDNLNAQARYMLLTNSNEQLVQLLNSYAPKWQDAGQSLADSLLGGLNSKKQSIADAVREMTNLRGGSLDGYAKGTSYNSRSGLYDTDEKGFELSTKGSVAYVSKGAGILNHMQSLKAIKDEVSKQMSTYANKLRNAVNADQYRMGQLAIAGFSGYSNSNTTNNNDNSSINFNVDKFINNNETDIEQIANELGIYARRNKKC
ncbi:phage tail tape measure protein [Clostridium botulinum]|nr:phage tail tape measure protein [Clostridium botulinum]NFS95841.1 phage tail tape measure protein [Clostridium botulinum]